jgi:hypothetical protein
MHLRFSLPLLFAGACHLPTSHPESPQKEPRFELRLVELDRLEWEAGIGPGLTWSASGETLAIVGFDEQWFWSAPGGMLQKMSGLRDLGTGFAGDTFLIRDAEGLGVLDGASLSVNKRVATIRRPSGLGRIWASPDQRYVLSSSESFATRGGNYLIDLHSDRAPSIPERIEYLNLTSVVWLPEQAGIVCAWVAGNHGESSGLIRLSPEGQVVAAWRAEGWGQKPMTLVLSPDGTSLICSGLSGGFTIFDPLSLELQESDSKQLAIFPVQTVFQDSHTAWVRSWASHAPLELWDLVRFEKLQSFEIGELGSMQLSPDREHLAVASSASVRIFRIEQTRVLLGCGVDE